MMNKDVESYNMVEKIIKEYVFTKILLDPIQTN